MLTRLTALTEENRLDRSIQAKGGISVPMIGTRAAIPASTDCVSDIFAVAKFITGVLARASW
jgi:hypothetical protein